MGQLESVGWQKVTKKDATEMTELDISKIFKIIDVDKSGSVSRTVSIGPILWPEFQAQKKNLNISLCLFRRPNLLPSYLLKDLA